MRILGMKSSRLFPVYLSLLLILDATAQSDVLLGVNGERFRGRLIERTEFRVVFESELAGRLILPADKVLEIESSEEGIALTPEPATATSGPDAKATEPVAALPSPGPVPVTCLPRRTVALHRATAILSAPARRPVALRLGDNRKSAYLRSIKTPADGIAQVYGRSPPGTPCILPWRLDENLPVFDGPAGNDRTPGETCSPIIRNT